MYCPHCGASVNEEAHFCSECGGRLKDLGNTEALPEDEVRLDDIIEEPAPAPAEESTPTDIIHTQVEEVVVKKAFPLWQLIGLLGLMMVIASASVVDTRPKAIRQLIDEMNHIFQDKTHQ